jgi:hypothetical protein
MLISSSSQANQPIGVQQNIVVREYRQVSFQMHQTRIQRDIFTGFFLEYVS